MSARLQRLKPWMLPIAILCGFLFHRPIAIVQWIVPYLIFTMLLITFCRVKPSEFRPGRFVWPLLLFQLVVSICIFLLLRNFDLTLAQSLFICVICPTATAAPVVTGMLGGSIPRVATYSVMSNLVVAISLPFLLTFVGGDGFELDFFRQFTAIAVAVGPLIIFPLLCAFGLYFFLPKVHAAIANVQGISFYLWAVSLVIVVGRSVSFMLAEPSSAVPEMILIALGALLICVAQFLVGRVVGRHCGDRISAAQGLGQKNTVLAIWLCLSFLNPLSSVGPAAYILWQNLINSGQLYMKQRRGR